MSVHVFFAFSEGLVEPLHVPAGTKQAIQLHVEDVESTLGLKRTRFKDNPIHWDHFDPDYQAGFPGVADDVLCQTVAKHNGWVRWLYFMFEEWAQRPVDGGETITPGDAESFWHALTILDVRPNRWTCDYYRERMDAVYDVMRGRECEGVRFDEKPLTPQQAGAVIRIFAKYLDTHELSLEVPMGHDRLASSGEYDWCEKCGAVDPDDSARCRKRKCPL